MGPYVDNVRDFKIAAYVPEIVSQMFDRGAPTIICMGLTGQHPSAVSVPAGTGMIWSALVRSSLKLWIRQLRIWQFDQKTMVVESETLPSNNEYVGRLQRKPPASAAGCPCCHAG
jgi:hypothetical protein